MKTYDEACARIMEAMLADTQEMDASKREHATLKAQFYEVASHPDTKDVLECNAMHDFPHLIMDCNNPVEHLMNRYAHMLAMGVVIGQRMEKQELDFNLGAKTEEPDQNYIPTYTGKALHFLNPKPEEIDVKDIIHSLARLPRYLGHTRNTITVAEHTVRMCWFLMYTRGVSRQGIRYAALHDAPEAYLGEWPKPLKLSVIAGKLREVEDRLLDCILTKYDAFPSLGEKLIVEQTDRGIVHAETELSGNMPDQILPIKLAEADKMVGRSIYDWLNGANGWNHYGWTTLTAEDRLRELFEKFSIA